MRKYLAFILLLGGMAVSSTVMAGVFTAPAQSRFDDNSTRVEDLDWAQYKPRNNRRRLLGSFNQRGGFGINRRLRPVPGQNIRRRTGVLRTGQGRPVTTGAGRDIGAGVAVQTARRRAAGEVLGVRRKGAVYSVKVLDRGRVRIVTIDAYSGSVLDVR